MTQSFIRQDYMLLVENVAKARGDKEIERKFIVAALCKIERGEAKVMKYPFGAPSLKDVYNLAVELSMLKKVVK